MTRLQALVGPACGDEDPLLASQCAIDIANACLLDPSLKKPPADT